MAANKKILFISYDGMTDPLGQSQVIPYLAGLTKYGYEFTILSCDKPAAYKINKSYVDDLLKPYPIKWTSIQYHKSPPVLSSLYDFYQLKKTARQLHKKENFDMVHTRPGLPTLVALWLKNKYDLKFLNDVRGFWADERVDGGMWNLNNPVYKKIYSFFKSHELKCIKKADYTTCLTYKAKQEIQSWKNIPNQPIPVEVIPCSVDINLFDPKNINETYRKQLKSELKINEDDIIVSYLGSIGGWYLTDEMMEFCKTLLTKIPKTKLLFISPHRHEIILEAAKKFDIPADKIIIRKGLRHEVPVLLSFSNYSLFFIKACYSKISSSPTKHGEIMAMGIPVITNSGVGDVEEITTKYNAGIVLKNLNTKAYEDACELIKNKINFDKKEIIAGAKQYYNLDGAVQKYLSVYKKILD